MRLEAAEGPAPSAGPAGGGMQRAWGAARVAFAAGDGATRLKRLGQAGASRIRLPRVLAGGWPTAVVLNTAGGVTGGDRFSLDVEVGPGARAVVTSQTAERLYRRLGGSVARIGTRLAVGAGGRLDWLPQEMIVFDGAALDRRLEIDLAADATLVAVESLVLGRTARGERVRAAALADRWRLRRDGRLVFADALRLQGDPEAILAGRATGEGARAIATAVYAGPDAAARLDPVRALLATLPLEAGASLVEEGVLVARFLAADGDRLRGPLGEFLAHLAGGPLPAVWRC